MSLPNHFDEIAETGTLASGGATLASPLAEVAATELPPVVPVEVYAATPAMPALKTLTVVEPAMPVAKASASVVAPALGTLPSTTAATLPMLGALLLVVGLILLLGKLVKRVQAARTGQGAALTVKGGVQVGAKERVVWMQAGDTHLLLGVSAGHVQTLHVFDTAPDFVAPAATEPSPVAATEMPASRDFSERLKTLLAHARAKGVDVDAVAPVAANKPAGAKPHEPMLAAATKAQFSFRA